MRVQLVLKMAVIALVKPPVLMVLWTVPGLIVMGVQKPAYALLSEREHLPPSNVKHAVIMWLMDCVFEAIAQQINFGQLNTTIPVMLALWLMPLKLEHMK